MCVLVPFPLCISGSFVNSESRRDGTNLHTSVWYQQKKKYYLPTLGSGHFWAHLKTLETPFGKIQNGHQLFRTHIGSQKWKGRAQYPFVRSVLQVPNFCNRPILAPKRPIQILWGNRLLVFERTMCAKKFPLLLFDIRFWFSKSFQMAKNVPIRVWAGNFFFLGTKKWSTYHLDSLLSGLFVCLF